MNKHNTIKEYIKQCASILQNTNKLLVITGAGISAESGMPTYRGPGGIYEKNPGMTSMLSEEGLRKNPAELWQHLNEMRSLATEAKPNAAHCVLAGWEQKDYFSSFLIATQNIDGLHQKAGNERVTELHGSLWEMACSRTKDYADDEKFSKDFQSFLSSNMRENILQRWSRENDREIWDNRTVPFTSIPPYDDPDIRPNILFFNESYGNRLLWVNDFIRNSPDTVLVIGCSGGVAILERLLRSCLNANSDCMIININAHEDCITYPHIYLPMPAGTAMKTIDSELLNNLPF